jgi:hypothetical protein
MKVLTLFVVMLIAFASGNTETLYSKQSLSAVTPEAVVGFITNFLEAAFGEAGEAAASCINNGENIFKLFETSIDEFRKGGLPSIISGLVKVGTAIQEIPKELDNCEEGTKVAKLIGILVFRISNPVTLAADVGKAVIWNGFRIFADGTGAAISFDKGDLSKAGKQIGNIVHLVWGKSFKSVRLTGPTQASIDTVEGILVGAFGDDAKEVVVCVNDGEAVFADIEAAIQEFEKGGVTNIVSGLYHIGEALEELPQELKDCKQAEAILADIERVAAEFKAPKKLVIHVGEEVLWHGKDIYRDITGATTDFKDGQYEPAGEAIGDIVKLLLVESVTNIIKTSA